MKQTLERSLAALLALVVVAAFLAAPPAAAQGSKELAGTASVSGTVTSPTPFKAARVYFRNVDRRMQYMVYTAGGKYNAMYLLPGNYEMRVAAAGSESEPTRVVLKPGKNAPQNAILRPARDGAQAVTLDEMFPAGPGQRFVKDVCLGCHAPDDFGSRQLAAPAWDAFVEAMLKGG